MTTQMAAERKKIRGTSYESDILQIVAAYSDVVRQEPFGVTFPSDSCISIVTDLSLTRGSFDPQEKGVDPRLKNFRNDLRAYCESKAGEGIEFRTVTRNRFVVSTKYTGDPAD